MSDNRDQHDEDKDKEVFETQPLIGSRTDMLRGQQRNFYLSGIAHILIFIPVVIVLAAYDDECDKPVREWLITIAVVSGVYVLSGVVEAVGSGMTKIGGAASCLIGLLSLFNFVWYIVGSVWVFSDDDCEDDWSSGYTMSMVLLVIFYVEIIIIVLLLCCCCCCVGLVAGIAATTEPNRLET